MREHVEKRLETRFGIAARVDGNQVFDDRTIPGERVERGRRRGCYWKEYDEYFARAKMFTKIHAAKAEEVAGQRQSVKKKNTVLDTKDGNSLSGSGKEKKQRYQRRERGI